MSTLLVCASKRLCQHLLSAPRASTVLAARTFCDKSDKTGSDNWEWTPDVKEKKSGFAEAFKRYSEPAKEEQTDEKEPSFAYLLRHSKFIDLGDPEGKIVSGKIIHVVNDDLYIDFGWKFNCVCIRPSANGEAYVRGAKVRLRIKSLELSSKFLGSSKDLTLREADCQLLGLIWSPVLQSKEKTEEAGSV